MSSRPAVRALLIADIGDARQEARRVGERADHALISARPRSHGSQARACQRRRVTLDHDVARHHGRTGASRVRRRCNRQRVSRGNRIRRVADSVPGFGRVELLTARTARARGGIGEQLVGQEALTAGRRTRTRRAAHGRRRVGKAGQRSRQYVRARGGGCRSACQSRGGSSRAIRRARAGDTSPRSYLARSGRRFPRLDTAPDRSRTDRDCHRRHRRGRGARKDIASACVTPGNRT
jgi:hypothetical protein